MMYAISEEHSVRDGARIRDPKPPRMLDRYKLLAVPRFCIETTMRCWLEVAFSKMLLPTSL